MKKFIDVESAYEAIASAVIQFPRERAWDIAWGKFELFPGMVSARWGLSKDEVPDNKGKGPSEASSDSAMDAALYLRDYLLETTKQQIWGLTFTLFPTGKFKIEYDYNKPEGYEETDETINLSDAVDRLQKLGVEVEVTHKKN